MQRHLFRHGREKRACRRVSGDKLRMRRDAACAADRQREAEQRRNAEPHCRAPAGQ